MGARLQQNSHFPAINAHLSPTEHIWTDTHFYQTIVEHSKSMLCTEPNTSGYSDGG
jgi:hypothetical protein